MPAGVRRPPATQDVACELCGTSEYDVVGRKDREGLPLQTVICRRCGLVRTNPRPPDAEIDRYYEGEYRADYSGAAAPARRKILRGMLGARDRLATLRPFLRPGARAVDVGCGAGELVYLLRREAVDAIGLEPGAEYADFARRALGIDVQTATVHTAAVEPGSQDLVTMFHCLEHVAHPKQVLATVRTWLRPGGHVVVEVPNVDSTVQAPAHRFHYAHLYHYSAATLAALGDAAGLRPVRTEYSADAGNVTVVFGSGSPAHGGPERLALDAPAAHTKSLLRAHTTVRHYLSPTPYLRAIARLRRRITEDRLLRRFATVEDIVRWAQQDAAEAKDAGSLR